MNEETTLNKEVDNIRVPENAKFKVYWYDRPENYNRDNRLKIKNDIAKKYGLSSENVKVIFRHSQDSGDGNKIDLGNTHIDNILDKEYQKKLFREYVEREEKNVDFERLMKLDDTINSEIDFDFEKELNKVWRINRLEVNNFLSFGEGNKIRYDRLSGLVVVTSEPENQGGKTTFCLDSIKFLLFGVTTKTNKNEQLFNSYAENNKLSVIGELNLDGEVIVIERIMTKSVSNSGNVNINNKVNFYKENQEGKFEKLNKEDATQTQNKINESIGRQKDFDSVILATEKTLDNLIDSTPTENGKLLNRFIGTEVFHEKEDKARKHYNEFAKNMLSNTYDVVNLREDIRNAEEAINKCNSLLEEKKSRLDTLTKELEADNKKKDELNTKKKPIDESIKNVDKEKLERELNQLTEDGKTAKNKKEELENKLKEIGDVTYDEERYTKLNKDLNDKKQKVKTNENEIERLEGMVNKLENDQICPTCKRPLDEVDHSDEIKKNKDAITNLKSENEKLNKEIENISEEVTKLEEDKKKVDEKNRVELERDKKDTEIENLRVSYKEKKDLLDRFSQNSDNIEENKQIDNELEKLKSQIKVKEGEKDQINREIERLNSEVANKQKEVDENNKLIEKIQREKEVERLYKVYIEMVGKKGVTKIVLMSVLPTINAELDKLLDDVSDFSISLDINHKDEVEFYIHSGGATRLLMSSSGFERVASSLALRAVLGRVSNLPMPNFVVFDEVLGKVGESNMPRIKHLLDKISDMYDIVFFITHSNLVKDWADTIVSVKNEGKISKLDVNN